jgi:aryl-alcohol dehydrogenase-like predicted oxidoreductase
MIKRTLGRTGLQVSALGLGTVELGMDYGIKVSGDYGQPAVADAIRLVHAALEAGLNYIDTARAYGQSEMVLGQALQQRREQVILATKVATRLPDGSLPTGQALKQRMLADLEASLRELQTDYVDVWQLHNLDAVLFDQLDLVAEVFAKAQADGKVRFVGASTYGAELPLAALQIDLFDLLQVTYSVLDQRLADQVFSLAAQKGVGIVVRSVLLQGVLTERGDHLPDHLEPLRQRSRQFRQLVADSTMVTPAQIAIAFALAQPHISTVLVGMRTESELHENLPAVAFKPTSKFLAACQRLRLDDDDLLNPGTWRVTNNE